MSDSRPIVALIYDFDKTLCTKDMQEYSFIPKVNMDAKDFGKNQTHWLKKRKWIVFLHICI